MNDPRITAYALNELQGAEREKFEADLAGEQHLQRDLLAACEITDALGEVSDEPGEGLEPQARARLLREAIANQQSFRARRKIISFAVPVSLAAAASIALLLLVSGGITTQKPAVAAASAPGAADDPGFSGGFTAKISSTGAALSFKGMGYLTNSDRSVAPAMGEQDGQSKFSVQGIRTVHLSENAKAALRALQSPDYPEVRQRSLLSSDDIPLWGVIPQPARAGSDSLAR